MKRAWLVCVIACGDPTEDDIAVIAPVEPRAQQAASVEAHGDKQTGYVGVITPRGLAEVTTPFTSTVTAIDVKLGDRVTRGQQLAVLDARPLNEELRIARATLKRSQAESAKARVEQRSTEVELERERKAYEQGVSSQAELSTAEFNQRAAVTNVQRASANVDEQRARIAQLEARLTDATLRAPIDGHVALLYVRVGDRIEEGRFVIRVISSQELYVKFAIPAEKIGTVTPNDEVDVVIGGKQSITTRGIVRHVAPELDPVAQMILADADLIGTQDRLQSGLVCHIVRR